MEKGGDLGGVVRRVEGKDVVFIDEIEGVSGVVEE